MVVVVRRRELGLRKVGDIKEYNPIILNSFRVLIFTKALVECMQHYCNIFLFNVNKGMGKKSLPREGKLQHWEKKGKARDREKWEVGGGRELLFFF